MKQYLIGLLFWSLAIYSGSTGCYSYQMSNKCVHAIYLNRDSVLYYFNKWTILTRGDDTKGYIVQIYDEKGYQQFSFDRANKNDFFELNETSLFYVTNDTTHKLNFSNEEKNEVKQSFEKRFSYMQRFKIAGVNSDFANLGVNLTIYACDGVEIDYIADSSKVTNVEWAKYIKSLRSLGANWFYKPN